MDLGELVLVMVCGVFTEHVQGRGEARTCDGQNQWWLNSLKQLCT